MLAVKYVSPEGSYQVYEATTVCFDRSNEPKRARVIEPDGSDVQYFNGTLYVMNGDGTTIDVIRFDRN